ncbi:MarR family transcriptional regulator [Saccharopolyspora pogona]|uniref:MarR family transcriptional regulator n=1 Tax=Saccharopolyspora pogona TaxID=333966 RepID=UPI00168963DA|nr:MarR family transcriptional regulator [Saccharopolyspora pogona]
MPSKNDNARTTAKQRRLKAVPTADTDSNPMPARTESQDKVWAALHANLGATTTDIAEAAGVGRSTAGKILATWAKDSSATRISGIGDGGRRSADCWTMTHTDQITPLRGTASPARDDTTAEPAAVDEPSQPQSPDPNDESTAEGQESAEDAREASGVDGPGPIIKRPRLSKGELRGMVEDYLTERPGEEFSPNAIGTALNRSSGAVNNALEKLVADGYAVQTEDKPKRFAAKQTDAPASY